MKLKVPIDKLINSWHICVICKGNGVLFDNPNKAITCYHCEGEGSFVYET